MIMMGGIASNTGFTAAELEAMSPAGLMFWATCLSLYQDELKKQTG